MKSSDEQKIFYGKIIHGDKMKSLYDFNYEQMCDMALEQGWKKFRGHQIFQWLYRKRVSTIDEMSDLSKDTREILKQNYSLASLELRDKQVSSDGTCKYLLPWKMVL